MLALRHSSDPLSPLPHDASLDCHREDDADLLASLQSRPVDDIRRRFIDGHRAYVARLDGEPAAFGWVATATATIGELDVAITLPARQRYLWNFVTLPRFRGRGIYPRLLRTILEDGRDDAEWWWIMYAPENRASGAGIAKAGFTPAASVAFDATGRVAFAELRPGAAPKVERLLALPSATGGLTPCWRCVRAGRGAMSCVDGRCRCDYQRPDVDCAA